MVLIELRTQGCATFVRLTSLHPGLIWDHPFGVREPQWLRTEFTLEETDKRRKEDTGNAETYLCGSVLVQNSLLEPCSFRQGYAARVVSPGGPEKGRRRRSQAERLRETAFRPSWCANHRPCRKHWGSILTTLSLAAMRLLPENHWG